MTPLAIIPAKKNSRGVCGKNFRDFCGKPLWEWAVRLGVEACSDAVLTTDAYDEIGHVKFIHTFKAGIVRRPDLLATDAAPMLPVIQHAVELMQDMAKRQWDVVVLLQPTSPLRRPEHVRAALKLLETSGADSVVSVVEIPAHYSPDYAMRVQFDIAQDREVLVPFLPDAYRWKADCRQNARKAYSRDGTVYVTRRSVIEAGSLYGDKCVPLIIPPHESANIDTEEDWQRAEEIMRKRLA